MVNKSKYGYKLYFGAKSGWIKSKLEHIITWPNFTFGQIFNWIGANNDQIWLPMGYMSDSEQCSNRLELYLI